MEINPSTHKVSQQQDYNSAQVKCWSFPTGWILILLPLCFQKWASFLLRGRKYLRILPKFGQKLIGDWKITAIGQEAEKSRCGAWSRSENVKYSNFNKNNCKTLFVSSKLHVSITRRLEKQITPPQQLEISPNLQRKLQWLLPLAFPGHCTLRLLEN